MEASTTRGMMTGRFLRLALPVVIVVFAGASSPWMAQRAPWILFPVLAVAVAVLVVLSFVNSLVRFVRHYRSERRLRVFPVVVNAIALVFLVILPFTHLLRVIAPSRDGSPPILTGFGARLGAEGTRDRVPTVASTSPAAWVVMCWRRPTGSSPWRGTTAAYVV